MLGMAALARDVLSCWWRTPETSSNGNNDKIILYYLCKYQDIHNEAYIVIIKCVFKTINIDLSERHEMSTLNARQYHVFLIQLVLTPLLLTRCLGKYYTNTHYGGSRPGDIPFVRVN